MWFSEAEGATASFLNLAFGAYSGLIIDAKYFRGTPRQIHETSSKKTILRFTMIILFIAPFIYLPAFMGSMINKLYLRVIFFYFLPSFLGFFLIFGYSKVFFTKLNLVNTECGTTTRPFKQKTSTRYVFIESRTESGLSGSVMIKNEEAVERPSMLSQLTPDFKDERE